MRLFLVKFDPTSVKLAADKLGNINTEELSALTLVAVNKTAQRAWDLSLDAILNGINLTPDQVGKRMRLTLATDPARPTASISAQATPSPLSSYGAQMPTTQVNWTTEFIKASGRKFGTWEEGRWTPRIGRPKVGVDPGQKAVDGVSVEVVRGARKNVQHGFLIVGKNGQTLLATRPKKGARGSYEVRYGPAVYQLLRAALQAHLVKKIEKDLLDSVMETFHDLEKEFLEE